MGLEEQIEEIEPSLPFIEVLGDDDQFKKFELYIDTKMEAIKDNQDEVSFDGIHLDKNDFITLESLLTDKFQQGEGLNFTKKVDMKKKLIVIKGKDFKKVSAFIQEMFVKLRQAEFP